MADQSPIRVTFFFSLGYTNVLSLHSFLSGLGEFLSQDMEKWKYSYLTIADYVPNTLTRSRTRDRKVEGNLLSPYRPKLQSCIKPNGNNLIFT